MNESNDTEKLLKTALEAAEAVRKEVNPPWWKRLFFSAPKTPQTSPCQNGYHNFGKWEFLRNIAIMGDNASNIPIRRERAYIRHCCCCGAPETKKIIV